MVRSAAEVYVVDLVSMLYPSFLQTEAMQVDIPKPASPATEPASIQTVTTESVKCASPAMPAEEEKLSSTQAASQPVETHYAGMSRALVL